MFTKYLKAVKYVKMKCMPVWNVRLFLNEKGKEQKPKIFAERPNGQMNMVVA